jgi:hypothetical protein
MESKPVSSFKTALNYGLITAVLMIVYGLILFLMDIGFEQLKTFGYIGYVIVVVMLILGIRAHKKASGGFISYGKGFTVAFLIVLVAYVISSIYNYFYFMYIDPGMAEEIASQAAIQAEDNVLARNPDATQQDLDMAVSMAEKFSTPVWMVVWGFVWSMVIGTVLSLIIPIFFMKNKPIDK